MSKAQLASESSFFDRLLIAAFALGTAMVFAIIDLAPRDDRSAVAVVFPPWVDGATAAVRASAAGAALLRTGRYAFIVVVQPQSAGYPTRALRAGAMLLLDPQGLAGCLSRVSR